MPIQTCLSVRAIVVASIVCAASAGAQPRSSAVAIARPDVVPERMVERSRMPVNRNIDQRLESSIAANSLGALFVTSRDIEFPAPLRDPHDGNYARQGAIIGALATGVASAVIVGLFAKRDCEPGLCGSEFQRGALVGGGVGLAAGGVLGWLIGAEIARPAETLPPS